MARAKKSKSYFTKITDMAISAYNKNECTTSREKIYRRFIYPAFMKLTENIINKVKPDYIDSTFQDLQTDLVTYLTARLDKFNPAAGKAYSYYTRTSFNYLIQTKYQQLTSFTENIAVHMHVINAGYVPFDFNTLSNYIIVHQYDRIPELKRQIFNRYSV